MQSARGGGPKAARPGHVLRGERGAGGTQAQGGRAQDEQSRGGEGLRADRGDDGEALQHLPPRPCRSFGVQHSLV